MKHATRFLVLWFTFWLGACQPITPTPLQSRAPAPPSVASLPFDGFWKTPCDERGEHTAASLHFNGGRYEYTMELLQPDCRTLTGLIRKRGAVIPRGAARSPAGAQALDFTQTSLEAQIARGQQARFISEFKCGADWAEEKWVDVAGMDCDGKAMSNGQVYYGADLIEDGVLHFDNLFDILGYGYAGNGIDEDHRPTRLYIEFFRP